MTRLAWWSALGLFSVGLIALDVVTGPYVLFPITFVIPIYFASVHLGRGPGIGFASVLAACRFVTATTVEADFMPGWAAVVNAGINLVVLGGLVLLAVKIEEQRRALAKRVQVLEGILPICSFCKRIRRPDGTWEQIEMYVSHHSAATFSHGFCEACGREHYPELFSVSNPPNGRPDAAPGRGAT